MAWRTGWPATGSPRARLKTQRLDVRPRAARAASGGRWTATRPDAPSVLHAAPVRDEPIHPEPVPSRCGALVVTPAGSRHRLASRRCKPTRTKAPELSYTSAPHGHPERRAIPGASARLLV